MGQQVSNTKDAVKKFGETTTLHGVRGACDGSSHIIQRIVWFTLLLTGFMVYSYVTFTSVSSYFQYNSVTKISTSTTDSLEFPAVTICDQNLLPLSIVKYYNSNITNCFIEGLFHGIHDNNTFCLNLLSEASMVDLMITKRIELFDEMFEMCLFNQAIVDCKDYFTPLIYESGTCFTFMSSPLVSQMSPLRQTAGGFAYGLYVLMDAKVDEYFISAKDGKGIRVSVHDPNYFPSVEEDSFALQPGIEAYVAIHKSVRKTLTVPYSELPCKEESDNREQSEFLKYMGLLDYSYGGCRIDCLYDYAVSSCGCALMNGSDECSLLQYVKCVTLKIYEFYQSNHSSACSCLKLCTEVQYDYQTSMLAYPTPYTIQRRIAQNMTYRSFEYMRKNMISLNVYFQSMEYDTIEQVPSKTGSEIIADIGGQMGLFLGASLITVFEILELLCLIMRKKLGSRTQVTKVKEFGKSDMK